MRPGGREQPSKQEHSRQSHSFPAEESEFIFLIVDERHTNTFQWMFLYEYEVCGGLSHVYEAHKGT